MSKDYDGVVGPVTQGNCAPTAYGSLAFQPWQTMPVAPAEPDWKSKDLDKLATALAKAQAALEPALKDSKNPHFNSKYADLSAVWAVVREPLAANGLSVVQMPSAEGGKVTLTTMLLHTSGQFLISELTMTASKSDPQGIGSCITYARRYALAAILGVAQEDDDGNAASAPARAAPARPAKPPVEPSGRPVGGFSLGGNK